MEDSYIICLEKDKTNKIINQNLQANFEKRIDFLKQIEIFKVSFIWFSIIYRIWRCMFCYL